MNTFLTQRFALGALAAIGLHGAVLAHGDDAGGPAEGSQWGLGVAVMAEKKPYRDFDNKTEVLPFVTFENRWVRVFGPGIEFKLGKTGPAAFGLTANYGMDGYKASDSPVLDGMARRKGSAWLGAKASLRGEPGQLSAEWSADASGNSKGQKFKLGVERRFTFGDLGLTPRLSATWLDRKFVQYYYGVETTEARAGRTPYSAGSTVNTELGLRLDYRPAPQHTVFADLGAMALGREIKSSPLVGRSSLPEVRVGYLYRF
jgi:outer membrane protein